jgi:hypothetical protein
MDQFNEKTNTARGSKVFFFSKLPEVESANNY